MADSLFVPVDADTFVPTELSIGPWSREALHGGPVAALLVRELESLSAPCPMRLTRITIELTRPVPLEPLWVISQVVRPGAKVNIVEAAMGRRDGAEVAKVRAVRIRTEDVDFPDGATDEVPPLPDEAAEPASLTVGDPDALAYHSHAVEHRYTSGRFGVPGPIFDWIRLTVPVVPGEEPTGWQRAAAAADFGNGISAVSDFGSSLFINPDLTVHLWREPDGEWIGLDAETRTSSTGIGMAESALWDRSGRVGRSAQSLLLDRL
jgi:Acyl-CoA thioesterase C-terminal domain/Acyl-CoA thioesterase N-terminal domain